MMIKVTGVYKSTYNPNYNQAKTKYYVKPTKKTIKQDFGLLLDNEIKKMHFEKYA